MQLIRHAHARLYLDPVSHDAMPNSAGSRRYIRLDNITCTAQYLNTTTYVTTK